MSRVFGNKTREGPVLHDMVHYRNEETKSCSLIIPAASDE